METAQLIKELERLIELHKGKTVGVGEVRIDYLADDCLRKIHELMEKAEKWDTICEYAKFSDNAFDVMHAIFYDELMKRLIEARRFGNLKKSSVGRSAEEILEEMYDDMEEVLKRKAQEEEHG